MKALPIASSSSSSSSSIFTSTRSRISLFSSLNYKFHHHHQFVIPFPLTKLHSLHFTSLQCYPISPSSSSPESHESFADESNTVHVKFQLKKECSFGEQFAIVGNHPNFGFWDPDNAIPLNWSDDHVWNLELDVPIGKSILFKFILKEITGSILWQPGPDRVLKTWETNNTIVLSEDWEDATLQKLVEEEELICDENVDPADNSGVRFVAEDLMQQNASDVNKEEIIPDVESNPENGPVVADTTASSEEKAISIVADNISNSNEEPAVNASHQVLKDELEADSNKDDITFNKILENNARTTAVLANLESTDVEENLMIEEGDPVLVLGLDYSETEVDGEDLKSRSAFDASVEVNEVENRDSQEKVINIGIEKEEKLDFDVDQHESEMVEVLSDVDQQLDHDLVDEENEENGQSSNKIMENDIQWGRRTIQRLLSNLGLMYQ